MKKNLLSFIILALLVVNLVLTSVMMFSVTSTNKKVSDLVGNIAVALNLELTEPGEGDQMAAVSLEDTEVYAIAGAMTIPLALEASAEDREAPKQGYLVCNISLSINTKHEDYKTYGSAEAMAAKEELIKDAISSIVSKYTTAELQADTGLENLKAELLTAVQDLFQSDFIYKISISEVKYG